MTQLAGKAGRQYCLALLVAVMVAVLPGCAGVPVLPASAPPTERQTFLDAGVERVLARQQAALAPGVAVVVLTNGGEAGYAVVNNIVATIQEAYDRD